jgi:hypothetical protein
MYGISTVDTDPRYVFSTELHAHIYQKAAKFQRSFNENTLLMPADHRASKRIGTDMAKRTEESLKSASRMH